MDTEKIQQDLARRFAEPLPEFYKRRIIVWKDEDREFIDKLDEIQIEGVKVIALTGSNNFTVKKLLNKDDTESDYLVYCPIAYESQEDNWLLDIELYSEEFRADLISIWMDEMGVPQTVDLRRGFKKYSKFLNAQSRRNKVASLCVPMKLSQLQVAIMAALAGLKTAKPNAVIKAVLQNGLNAAENTVYQEFVGYGIDEAFWRMVEQGSGYSKDSDPKPDLKRLAAHLLLTASTRTMRQEFLAGLDDLISAAHQAYCYDFVSEWMHSEDSEGIRSIAELLENELNLPERFMNLEISDLLGTEVFPCVHEVILVKLMKDIGDHLIDVNVITKTVEKRRTCAWYEPLQHFYEGILQLANMQAFYKTHAAGFHNALPEKVWKEYTSTYYVMDTYYRQFHKAYAASLKTYHPELSNLFAAVMEKVEGLYCGWFLGELGRNWSDVCAEQLRDYGRILEVPRQSDFYRDRIAHSDSKVYVIISDAMRYEVAVELSEQLRRETQSKVTLGSVCGIFPTITKFGMAALLPHKELSVALKSGKTERVAVLADGQSTEANNRDRLLKCADSQSVALKYKDIIGMKRADRQALVRGMNVVYIYHDAIDEAGHLDKSVFGACMEAMDEIKNMVRIITNEFGGANILITSDHGFLYTYSPLKEDEKVDKSTESDQDIEIGRRYAIMKKGTQPQYLLPVKFLDGTSEYEGFTPRESIRIKMKGGGLNFVHGGISLQEMVVPVIEYHFLRNDSREYKRNRSQYDTKPVTVHLLSASRKICNMIFSLDFYQKEAVGGVREAATCYAYFTDSNGKTVSDTATIIADKTTDDVHERIFRCTFSLKPLSYSNTAAYYLIIADSNGQQLSREEFQIDIAFAVADDDFFG
ncbi:MAG: BREX-1 system phosphatase PglZ type A [Clostridia bacterium]|nr:BREX-1 system phosphatase PglZ type A [Clostridia bacterium]